MSESIGKKAEGKIRQWLEPKPDYLFYRIPDQVSGFIGTSMNPCDFFIYHYPKFFAMESKATEHDRFDFNQITDYQYEMLMKYSKIPGVTSYVAVLFVTYKRAFLLDIRDIDALIKSGTKSINIKKIDKWNIPYREIETIPSRKQMLDYKGELV